MIFGVFCKNAFFFLTRKVSYVICDSSVYRVFNNFAFYMSTLIFSCNDKTVFFPAHPIDEHFGKILSIQINIFFSSYDVNCEFFSYNIIL